MKLRCEVRVCASGGAVFSLKFAIKEPGLARLCSSGVLLSRHGVSALDTEDVTALLRDTRSITASI